jgi:hypothetical protein
MPQTQDLKSLDQLIADVGGADEGTRSRGPNSLLIEHLQAARRDLLGSMRGEYRASLQQAEESIASISDKDARAGVKARLRNLLDSTGPTVRQN